MKQRTIASVPPFVIPLAICVGGPVLLVAVLWYASAPQQLWWPILGMIPFLILVVYLYGKRYDSLSGLLFPALFLFCGLAYALALPPGTVPDERSHFRTAYVYANLVSPGYDAETLRDEDWEFLSERLWESMMIDPELIGDTKELFTVLCVNDELHAHPELLTESLWGNDPEVHGLLYLVKTCPPQTKVGAVCGLLLGRILHLSPVALFYLGRVGNLLFCLALIMIALNISPLGKGAFMGTAFLPMAMHEFGSFSYDGPIIGMSFIAIALLLRCITGKGDLTSKDIGSLALTLFLLGPCKMVYSLLSILAFFIPSQRFASWRRAVLIRLLLFASPFVGVALFRLDTMLHLLFGNAVASSTDLDRRLWEYGTFYSLSDIIHHPLRTARLITRTIRMLGKEWIRLMVGAALGWLQRDTRHEEIVLPCLTLLALSSLPERQKEDEPNEDLTWKARIAFIGMFLMVFLGVVIGEMLIWTFNTEDIIQGVQGRYFLPVLPLVPIALLSSLRVDPKLHAGVISLYTLFDLGYVAILVHAVL